MLLEQLIHSLSGEERVKLGAELALPARSAKIFERLSLNGQSPSTKELCSEFGLSKTNLYRICSEIADDCVRILATAGEFPKLEFYSKKFLATQFTAELARTENRLLKEADPATLERFYYFAFSGMMGMPVNHIDLALMRSYGMKWQQARRNPPPDSELEIEMRLIFTQISALPARKKMNVDMMNKEAHRLLREVRAHASVSKNPMVRYFYYQSEWKAANYDTVSIEQRIAWIARTVDYMHENRSAFPAGMIEMVELMLAYERGLYYGEARAGFEHFRRSFRGQVPDSSRDALFLFRYLRLAVITHELETAHEIFRIFDSFPYSKISMGIYQPYLLLRSTVHILEGELSEAERLNVISRTLNADNDYFLSYEVEIRALEATCTLKRNDLELADLLVTRDLKWLQSRRYSLSQSPWPYFYQTIKAIILYRLTAEKPRPSLKKHYEEFVKIVQIYALLIEEETKELFEKSL